MGMQFNENPILNPTVPEMLSALQALPLSDRETFKGYFNSQFDISNFLAEYGIKAEEGYTTIVFGMPLFVSTYMASNHFDIVNNNGERQRYQISNLQK